MKLTKEDYMRLPKERLAELLVERDEKEFMPPIWPDKPTQFLPCYAPDGICTNPHMDCINCPRKTTGGVYTSPNTTTGTSTLKAELA